jgi:AIPR protein
MANINDFKIVNKHSKNYFRYLNLNRKFRETDKAKFGFYLFALECITNIKEVDRLKDMISDTEFRSIVFNQSNNDLGIDAVYIDEDNKTINLFNFKHREKFSVNRGLSTNDALISMKFVNCLTGIDTGRDLSGKSEEFIQNITEKLLSDDIWDMRLYMVSNENLGLPQDDNAIEQLKANFGLEVISYTLDDFSNFISERPEGSEATLLLNRNSVLSYEEEDLSSSKSYLIKLSVSELLRITGIDIEMRKEYNIEDIAKLKNLKLDFSVLFDNVRGYLGKTKFNKNIFDTLNNEPTKFFMFNNGLTMTADDIEVTSQNGNHKWKINLKNYQVVNGGQTLRTLFEFKDNNFDEEKLNAANVLVRVFKTSSEKGLTNKIAEYTNSQNAIAPVDLKSLDSLQIQIEKILKSEGILYVRKVGDFGDSGFEYNQRISMERFGQLLYSKLGYPDRASNQKKRIFEGYYDDIFGEKVFDIENSAKVAKKYQEISDMYEASYYEMYEQKVFYVIYLCEYNDDIMENIELIEEALLQYRNGASISESRKLIQKGFKDKLIDLYNTKYPAKNEIVTV